MPLVESRQLFLGSDLFVDKRKFSEYSSRHPLNRQIQETSTGPSSHMDRRIQAVISRMESEPSVKFAELAEMVRLSESRLRHLFKKETGITYKQLIRDFRMRKAEELLRTTFFNVKEIATEVGLSDSQFARDFQILYGMSPSLFRLRLGISGPRIQRRRKSDK